MCERPGKNFSIYTEGRHCFRLRILGPKFQVGRVEICGEDRERNWVNQELYVGVELRWAGRGGGAME